MKTTISIPGEVFERVERHVAASSISVSDFFLRAAIGYLDATDADTAATRIDDAITRTGQPGPVPGHRLLGELAASDVW